MSSNNKEEKQLNQLSAIEMYVDHDFATKLEEWDGVSMSLPLFIDSGKRAKSKRRWLTLNNYRNWHYQVSNGLKIRFKREIKDKLDFKIEGKVRIHYKYFAPDKRKRDLMNVISVIDKFFQDALVERGCIEADDLSIVVEVNSNYIGIDKENPRLDVTIMKIGDEEEQVIRDSCKKT